MLMALRYLTCYLGSMVRLIMIFLTTTVSVATTIGLMLTVLLIAVMAVLALIRVTHPPAPPYHVTLLFRQVRIRLGLLKNLTAIDEMNAIETKIQVADLIYCRQYNPILHV